MMKTPKDCCNCEECTERYNREKRLHWSDCAVHNEPAMKKGKCDCGEGFRPIFISGNELTFYDEV